jgi:DNA-binding Lrp family transcriptional regulator
MSNTPSPNNPQRLSETEQPPFNWRTHLRVHPAAELYPLMAEYDHAALKELAENIKVNGLAEPIVGWANDGQFILDGRNRLDAMALLGLLYETEDHHVGCKKWDGKQWTDRPGGRIDGWESPGFRNLHDGDPYEIALSLNVHRRHLTNDDKNRLIAELIKANPEKSNRQIAAQVKVATHPHVAKVRAKLEKAGDVETVSTSIDTKGRKQPAKRKGKARKKSNSIIAPPVPIETVNEAGDAIELGAVIEREWHEVDRALEAFTHHALVQIAKAIPPEASDRVKEYANIFAALVQLTARRIGNGEAPVAGSDYSIPGDLSIPHFSARCVMTRRITPIADIKTPAPEPVTDNYGSRPLNPIDDVEGLRR